MSELCIDYGWKSIYHHGEQLCGDHVESLRLPDGGMVMVLADGLGSGVKASILSTLTSKIIATMIAEDMPIEECVQAIADALPIDTQKNVAYSTFTIMRMVDKDSLELIQFDNPKVIMLRRNNPTDYPCEVLHMGGKEILRSLIRLQEDDMFIAVSDGCTHASATLSYNYSWTREDVADYMKIFAPVGYTAKSLACMLMDECYRLYGEHPLDDATACVIRVRRKHVVNVMFGPPSDRLLETAAVNEFLRAEGKHIVSGGTTARVISRIMGRQVRPLPGTPGSDIPPMSAIEGIDLVTEGILTMNRVNEYVANALADNDAYATWGTGTDGASRIARMLLEEATHVNFFVGTAVNDAHGGTSFSNQYKMRIVDELTERLRQTGKQVVTRFF